MSKERRHWFAEFGEASARNGFNVIPLHPLKKSPLLLNQWREQLWNRAQPALVKEWSQKHPDSGVGCVCGRFTVCFDIDMNDAAEVERSRKIVEAVCGPTPLVRMGRVPRIAMIYAASEPIVSVRFPFHDILGMGTQVVLFGLHPTAHIDYEWIGESTPANTPVDSLPIVSNAQVAEVTSRWGKNLFGEKGVETTLELENLVGVLGGSRSQLIVQLVYHLLFGRERARKRMANLQHRSVQIRNWGLVILPKEIAQRRWYPHSNPDRSKQEHS